MAEGRAAPAVADQAVAGVDVPLSGQAQHLSVARCRNTGESPGWSASSCLRSADRGLATAAAAAPAPAAARRRPRLTSSTSMSWAMSLGVSSRLSTRALTHHDRVVGQLVAVLGHRPGEDHDLDGGAQVLQHEDGHEVALLGPLALQAGDHAADRLAARRPRSRPSSAMRGLGAPAQRRLGAHQRVVAHVEAEHLLLERQASRLSNSMVGDRRPARSRCRRRPTSSPPNRVMMPMSRSRRRARVWSTICSKTVSRPLRGWPSVVEAAGLDQRLDRPLVEHREVDPVAEVVEVGKGAVGVALGDDVARPGPRPRCARRTARRRCCGPRCRPRRR